MKKKKNVLVFPCGSEIGLELSRALSYSKFFHVIGGSSVDDHGRFAYSDYLGGLPHIDDPAFLKALQEILSEREVQFLFPAHDSAVVRFARWASEGALFSTYVVTSPLPTCLTTRSKSATYKLFREVLPTPRVYDSVESVNRYPVFLKPDIGQGSKGTSTVHSREELRFLLSRESSLLICEHLPGNEHTVDCFTDRSGQLRFVGGRTRRRIANGISVNTLQASDPRFRELADRMNAKLTFRGLWFFQVKERSDGELVLMEIAPRAAGSSGFHRNMGVNLPLLSLHDALGEDVEITTNPFSLEMDRALHSRYSIDFPFTAVYIDLDDTLIVEGKINYVLVGLIYKWKSEGRSIHLLTRHCARYAEPASECLSRHWLHSSLFDSIHDVPEDAKKSALINSHSAIFIDDSHHERQEVANACQIPVFDINQALELFQ